MKRKIILSGELAKKYGAEHVFDIATPAEAVRALGANYKDFISFLMASEQRNVAYKVIADDDMVATPQDLHRPFSSCVRIVPVIGGAKSGVFGFIEAAALIGASFYLPTTALFALGSFAPSVASIAFGLGTSLALGGVSSLLSPHPKAGAPAEAANNQPSYSFNGPVNTTKQGQPVPVGYGRLIVGSAVISAGITADDYTASGITS